jgi:hypothetical protein
MKFNIVRDYDIISPSLEGILKHDIVEYEGLQRPNQIMRVYDIDSKRKSPKKMSDFEYETLSNYFKDLYTVYTNKLSRFVMESYADEGDGLKLIAMMQELIKVKFMILERNREDETVKSNEIQIED